MVDMMTHEQNGHSKLIEQARTLLSPYLDDELSSAERELVEMMLAQSPELQTELESLRATVNLVRNLPRAPAPRPFTLTEADVGLLPAEQRALSWWSWLKPAVGGVAILLAVVMAASYLLQANFSRSGQQMAAEVALAPAAPQAAEEIAEPAVESPAEAAPQESMAAGAEAVAEQTTSVTVEVEKVVEAEKIIEAERNVEVTQEEIEAPPAGEAAAPDTSAESKLALEAQPAAPLSTPLPATEMAAQAEKAAEGAVTEEGKEEIAAAEAAPGAVQEAGVASPTTALLFSAATPSPAATSLPTATPALAKAEAASEPELKQPAEDQVISTVTATVAPAPITSAQATQGVEQTQALITPEQDNVVTTTTPAIRERREAGEFSLISLWPVGVIIFIAAIALIAILWRRLARP